MELLFGALLGSLTMTVVAAVNKLHDKKEE